MEKLLKPIHPGEILREEFMIPLGLSSSALARATGVTVPRINEIVRGERNISVDTALRLGRYFSIDFRFWTNLQTNYDAKCVRAAAGAAIDLIVPRPMPKAA